LLNIDSALTLTSFPRRDDADDFFAIFVLHSIDVDHQQERFLHCSNRVPPLFTVNDTILAKDYIRIVKHERRACERQATVLLLVGTVLVLVPLETPSLYISYNTMKRTASPPHHVPPRAKIT
jgi:hypothetical protein